MKRADKLRNNSQYNNSKTMNNKIKSKASFNSNV